MTRKEQIEKMTKKLMTKHGLVRQGWKFYFSPKKSFIGQCRFGEKVILLSEPFALSIKIAEIEDTVLHEIAHVLVGPGHGHGKVWKAKCVEIGCRPYASKKVEFLKSANIEIYKYKATCPKCGYISCKNKKYVCSCPKCSKGVYNSNYKMNWIPNN